MELFALAVAILIFWLREQSVTRSINAETEEIELWYDLATAVCTVVGTALVLWGVPR